ncbi:MAG: hypothetical protein V4736_10745 [Bdellovibrionota bacterium]
MNVGNFRADLFFRLNVFPIIVPPLRERTGDIRPLVRKFKQMYKGTEKVFLIEVLKRFERYNWPGNVRELENEVQRLLVTTDSDKITAKDLHSKFFAKDPTIELLGGDAEFSDYKAFKNHVEDLERKLLSSKLKTFKNIRDAASEGLGISHSTLFSRLKALSINQNQKGNENEKNENSASNGNSGIVA